MPRMDVGAMKTKDTWRPSLWPQPICKVPSQPICEDQKSLLSKAKRTETRKHGWCCTKQFSVSGNDRGMGLSCTLKEEIKGLSVPMWVPGAYCTENTNCQDTCYGGIFTSCHLVLIPYMEFGTSRCPNHAHERPEVTLTEETARKSGKFPKTNCLAPTTRLPMEILKSEFTFYGKKVLSLEGSSL